MRFFPLSAMAALALPALFAAGPVAAQPTRNCHYDIRLHDPAALILEVTARCTGTGPVAFDRPGEDGMAAALESFVPGADGHSVRYRFRLGDLADLAASPEVAQRIGPAVVSPLSVWLSQPDLPGSTPVTLSITTEDGLDVAIGLPQHGGLLRMSTADMPYGGFAVFGKFTRRMLPAGGDAKIELVGFPGRLQLDDATIDTWVTDSAKAVAQYYGHFPLRHTLILATPVRDHAGIQFGQVRGGGGGTMLLQIGEQTTRAQLYDGWVLVHEMIHLGAPFVTGRSFWLMEGMATYGEPVIRARAGWYPVPQMWREFASQMPRGVDALTVESLDAVSRRGVYWGGAIFMLLADIDIRERSHGKASLETCFRAVLNSGGNTTVRWPRAEFLRICDAATGTGTMARLAARYAVQPAPLDLDALWRDLGVKLTADGVQFDDTAPKAALRRAITTGS